jgi:hypothetical protein
VAFQNKEVRARAFLEAGPGKRRNRPFKVLELDLSDFPTSQARNEVDRALMDIRFVWPPLHC